MPTLRTLLVDDCPAFLHAVARFFTADYGMETGVEVVGYASSGQEALEQVENLRPDLVLMDWSMPGMNGLEATRQLKAQIDCPLVVMLTGHDSPNYQLAAAQAGADGYVVKEKLGSLLLPLIQGL